MIEATEEVKEFLEDAFAYVEANSFEKYQLWKEWFYNTKRVDWKDNLSGFLPTVARWSDKPICVSIRYAHINGKKVVFWYATSQLVFYPAIDTWMKTYMPDAIRGDAQNFQNIVHSIERKLEEESKPENRHLFLSRNKPE